MMNTQVLANHTPYCMWPHTQNRTPFVRRNLVNRCGDLLLPCSSMPALSSQSALARRLFDAPQAVAQCILLCLMMMNVNMYCAAASVLG